MVGLGVFEGGWWVLDSEVAIIWKFTMLCHSITTISCMFACNWEMISLDLCIELA